ncbi:Pentatricopeptide repeat-containing protein [Thalictrum thalictroides]|uniref:Pentatricopeptide repeat-containing protein n=1 Tax=Thalictrum thalictroides TaxID=46969 RepID=A0A7J6VAL0_THATH|nr:Pentatricopeptide repeat-containing protein [Thalictrum thalictroides]
MAFFSRFRIKPLFTNRHFSSILNPDSTTPLTSKQKTRTALTLLKSEKNPEKILDICRAASLTPEFHLDRIAFSVAIQSLTKTQSFECIRSFLEELKTRPDLKNDRFFSHSMILYGQAGMIDNAIKTFREMREMGIPHSKNSLNALLHACLIAKKYKEVNRIFTDFPNDYEIGPNLDTYNIVIKAYCESGSSSSAYSVVDEMERKGYVPNATTFGTMLAGFYSEEKYEDVGKVLEMMEKRGRRVSLSIYNIRIQSLCKLKKSTEAKALFDGMMSTGMKPNIVTYYHLIYGFGKEGNVDEMKNLFNDMRRRGCEPDSNCYFTFIYYLCQGGDFETALRACKHSISKEWFPNFSTMKILVDGLVSISKVEEARELIGKAKERFPKNADLWAETEEKLPQ